MYENRLILTFAFSWKNTWNNVKLIDDRAQFMSYLIQVRKMV